MSEVWLKGLFGKMHKIYKNVGCSFKPIRYRPNIWAFSITLEEELLRILFQGNLRGWPGNFFSVLSPVTLFVIYFVYPRYLPLLLFIFYYYHCRTGSHHRMRREGAPCDPAVFQALINDVLWHFLEGSALLLIAWTDQTWNTSAPPSDSTPVNLDGPYYSTASISHWPTIRGRRTLNPMPSLASALSEEGPVTILPPKTLLAAAHLDIEVKVVKAQDSWQASPWSAPVGTLLPAVMPPWSLLHPQPP